MRRHKSDLAIGILTLVLLATGLIVIYMIGPMRANVLNSTYGTDYSEHYFFVRQLLNVALSLVAFVVAFKIPYSFMRKFSKGLMFLGLGLCVLLMLLSWMNSSLASCELGACRWYKVGSMSLQPAEILKLGLVLYLAQLMAGARKSGNLDGWREFWLPFIGYSVASLVLVVVIQKDLGTGVSMAAIIMAMLFMSGVKMKYFVVTAAVAVAAGVLSIIVSPHRLERLMTFNSAESSDAYHIENAMIAIGTGGLLGVGPGNSVQATGYLPESINDSVFAIIGETFGFVGLLAIVVCFTVLLLRLLRTARFLHNDEESLVVIGVFAWATAHVVVNIASMTGLVPLTGITLPLLSYGGTSMLFTAFALGLALQLSCYTAREPKSEVVPEKVSNVRRRQDIGRRVQL